MKKILLFLCILTLFLFTGCDKDNSKTSTNLHKREFVDMRYNEPENYSKKEPIDMDGEKTLIFRFSEDDNKTINLYYFKNTSLADENGKYEDVTINGVKWKKYHDTDFGVTYDTYDYIYNNGLYRIELNAVDKYQDEFDEFMKDISFE